MRRRTVPALWLLLCLCLCLRPAYADPGDLTALKRTVVADYAVLVDVGYEDALDRARFLAGAIDTFLGEPSEESLARARQAWMDARVPYTQTEAFRFYDGPIDAVEGRINSWP